MTITRYRHALRLRIALDRLPDCDDLTDLALDLGYSSHSHFTRAFRDHFGIPHSRIINILGAIAVFASMTNIVSGFLITDRMLKMFRQKGPKQ